MSYGRRKSDTWKARLIWGGAVLQAALFVLNLVAAILFLRTWHRLEAGAADLQRVARRANERLDQAERDRPDLWRGRED